MIKYIIDKRNGRNIKTTDESYTHLWDTTTNNKPKWKLINDETN